MWTDKFEIMKLTTSSILSKVVNGKRRVWNWYVNGTALFTKPPYSVLPYRTVSGGRYVRWLPLIF